MYEKEIRDIVREFPDRAIRWLLETPENIRGLLLSLATDLAARIDYSQIQRLDRTFISDNFRKREADLVFTAPFTDEIEGGFREVIIYILIETQSTFDPTMSFRILSYMLRIWESQRERFESENIPLSQWRFRPILPVVFYTGEQSWDEPLNIKQLMELPASLEEFVPQHKILFFNLKATPFEKLIESNHPLGWILQVIQKEKANIEEFKESLSLAIEHLNMMSLKEYSNWAKLVYFLMAFIYNRREESEHSDFFSTIESSIDNELRRNEVEKMGKTMAEALIEKGEARGEARGIKKGMIMAKQEALLRLIKGKFGLVPGSIIKEVKLTKKSEKLDMLFDLAITADTIDDLTSGLENEFGNR